MSDRYDTTGHRQAQFEPGSEGRVLANRLGITDPAEMADVELDLLSQLYDAVIESVSVDQRISVADLLEWHRRWLGNLYNRAGQYRTQNMGKAGFPFAACNQIPNFTSWDANKDAYFAAIQAGLDNYEPMRMLVKQVLRETAQQASGRASLQ